MEFKIDAHYPANRIVIRNGLNEAIIYEHFRFSILHYILYFVPLRKVRTEYEEVVGFSTYKHFITPAKGKRLD